MSSTRAEGERLQAEAYKLSSIEPVDLGPPINGLIYFFTAVSALIIFLRSWVRFFTEQRWGWDDILAVGGFLAFVPSNVLGVIGVYYGLGAHDDSLDAANKPLLEIRAIEYFMYYEILYFAASATTKVSITLTVLRLCDKQRLYRLIAIGNAVLMIVAAGAAGAFVLTNCRPISTYWNPDLGVCTFGNKGLGSLRIVSLVGSSFQMLSDWVSALLPFFIISSLQMPQRTKIALICILGLGIMASIAALARMLFYKFWDKEAHPEGYLYNTGVIVLTSQLEVGLGIIACSLPPLRRLIKNVYSSFRSRTGQTEQQYAGSNGTQLAVLGPQGPTHHSSAVNEQGKWRRLHDDDNTDGKSDTSKAPINGIVRQTNIEVESRSIEQGEDNGHTHRRSFIG